MKLSVRRIGRGQTALNLGSSHFLASTTAKQVAGCVAVLGCLTLVRLSALAADGQPTLSASVVATAADSDKDTRYGLFNWLDRRSQYGVGIFPEPFLVDDSDLEPNEFRVDWLHARGPGSRSDSGKAEIEKGFGLLTLELEVPYEYTTQDGQVTKGFDNINLGARYPLHQYVSSGGRIDLTSGVAVEAGFPVHSSVSKNGEFVGKVFNDAKLGDHFTAQTVLGHSTLL